jgi:cob(I)alamin adenosyltransferase
MLRKIAVALVQWLCARYSIALVAEARISNGVEAVARGQRYEAFFNEEDGLHDMFVQLRRDYFEKVGALSPGDTESLKALAMADRICREVERKVQTVIETGKLRAMDQAHVNKIASIRR